MIIFFEIYVLFNLFLIILRKIIQRAQYPC